MMKKGDVVFNIDGAHENPGRLVHGPDGGKRKMVFFFLLFYVKWAAKSLGHSKTLQMLFRVFLILMLDLKFLVSFLMPLLFLHFHL